MAIPNEEFDVVVREDGSIRVPAAEVARIGATPGQRLHLQLLSGGSARQKRKSARGVGVGVGKVSVDELLTWDDFEATHIANIDAVERKYGDSEQ